jgi:hypothetical protein
MGTGVKPGTTAPEAYAPTPPIVAGLKSGPDESLPKRHRVSAERVALVLAVLTALATAATAVLMVVSNRTQERLAAAEAYVTLKSRYYDIARALPPDWKVETGALYQRTGPSQSAWEGVRGYWYQSFDEWYTVTRVQRYPRLWDEYYREVLLSSLQNRRLRSVLCDMRSDEFRAGMRKTFVDEMERLYAANEPIRSRDAFCPVQ